MNDGSSDLSRLVAEELAQPVAAGAHALARKIIERHGSAVRAVLFYGSCLRKGDDADGLLDLYAIVDDYRSCYTSRVLAIANTVLPPNVFYLEATVENRVVRAKYAVVSLDAFAYVNSPQRFESYFWARFAQPCALVYAADAAARNALIDAIAGAVTTFVTRALVLVPPSFEAADLWIAGLGATYRTELRSERAGVAEQLYNASPRRYDRLTRAAVPHLPYPISENGERFEARLPDAVRRTAPLLWGLRRLQGKVLFLLRMLRNATIFDGAVDYAIWKIERHSGVRVDPDWRRRRFRLLALGGEVIRLYRRGAFR
jgi:hypothetical protein